VFGRRRPNVWSKQDVQVSVHRTVEVNVDVQYVDEERGSIKQIVTVRSQEEIDRITAELQMKKDFLVQI
jgi:hypothetical protein